MADNSKVHRSLQNCGLPNWILLYVTLLVPRIWRWLLDFSKICGPLVTSWRPMQMTTWCMMKAV